MPKLMSAPVATVSTTKEIRLEPKLRKKLVTELRAYDALHTQLKTIQHAMGVKKNAIEALRAETDEQSVGIEGFTVTLVAPIRHVFDPKTFVSNGGDLAIYNQSHIDVPSKPYTKISCPGADDE